MVVAGEHVDIGAQMASGLERSHAVSSRLALDALPLSQARERMGSNGAYATIVIPPDFTQTLLAAYGQDPSDTSGSSAEKATVTLLTNPRAGSIGVALATGVSEPALHVVSLQIGRQLSAEASKLGSTPKAGISVANPLAVVSSTFDPLPPNSALGLSAFYISLLSIMCGFVGAILVHTAIDAALGYGVTEIGPRWSQRMPVAISRWQTLLAKWVVALVLMPVLTGILLLVAIGLLGMNAPYPLSLIHI